MYERGDRVRQISGGRRQGMITEGMIHGGYVTVKWDNGREESGVHIRDIWLDG